MVMIRKLLAQQGTVASPTKIPAEDFRLNFAAFFQPAPTGTDALAVRSGRVIGSAVPGSGFEPLQAVVTAASTFTVKPGHFVVQHTTQYAGPFVGSVDADTVRAIATASRPGTGQFKAGYLVVHVYDQVYGDAQDGFDLELYLGSAASTSNSTSYPTLPDNCLILQAFVVNSAGAITPTGSPAPYTWLRGSIAPVAAGDTTPGVFDGQWRDEPTLGLQRWSVASNSWSRPHAIHYGTTSTRPVNPRPGDTLRDTLLGNCLVMWDGGNWRQLDTLEVANAAARDGLNAPRLYPGFRVRDADTKALWWWTGADWQMERRTYVSAAAPTGTVPEGSIWFQVTG